MICIRQLLKPQSERVKAAMLDELGEKLRALVARDSDIDREAELKVCVDADLADEIRAAMDECGVDSDEVDYFTHVSSVGDLTPGETETLANQSDCAKRELGWVNA